MQPLLRQPIRSLRANPARSVLTTLGIVVGISTVMLVLSAGAGFRHLIDAQVAAFGSNTLFIQTRVPPTTKQRASGGGGFGAEGNFTGLTITTFKKRDLDEIKKLPNVTGVYAMVTGQAVASYRENRKTVLYYGSSAERFAIDQHVLSVGRPYTASEDAGGAQVVILGSELARDLFDQDDPLGKTLRLGSLNFEVIGVYERQGGLGGPADDSAYIPLVTAQKKLLGIDHLTIGIVQVDDVDRSDATAEDIRWTLRRNHDIDDPAKDDFLVQTQAQSLEMFNVIFGGVTALLIAIAAISLVVGGVGIMNIMYVVVRERTPEIGLKKAVGATRGNILSEFLVEAVLVTVLGGVIGIALGAGLAWLVSVIAGVAGLEWAFIVPWYAIVIGFGVSAGIGIVFGVLPARSASRLHPIDALRRE